jgi:hypothetical protein
VHLSSSCELLAAAGRGAAEEDKQLGQRGYAATVVAGVSSVAGGRGD